MQQVLRVPQVQMVQTALPEQPEQRVQQVLLAQRVLQAQLESLVPSLHTPNSVGHPLGWMAEADWRGTIETLRSFPFKPRSVAYDGERFWTADRNNHAIVSFTLAIS